METFNSDPGLRDAVLASIAQHRAADTLRAGNYHSDGSVCAIGCNVDAVRKHTGSKIDWNDHVGLSAAIGVPAELLYLQDRIFERTRDRALQLAWPERFARAAGLGRDLSPVWPRFAIWLLEVELARWRTPASDAIAALYRRRLGGNEPTQEEWGAAAHAAYAAAHAAHAAAYAAGNAANAATYAANAAADAAANAADAATNAAYAATNAAGAGVYNAAVYTATNAANAAGAGVYNAAVYTATNAANAYNAADAAAWIRMSDQLIELMVAA